MNERQNVRSVKQMPFTDQFGDYGTYTGQVNEEGRPDGKGSMKYENGVFYEGTWTDGCQDKHAAANYERIRGGFTSWSGKGKQGVKHGMVLPWNARKEDVHDAGEKTNVRGMEWTDLNGDSGRYTGEVNHDRLPHGRGVMKYSFGLIAAGDWVNGVLKEGPGDRMMGAASSGVSVAGGMSVAGGSMSVGGARFGGAGSVYSSARSLNPTPMPMHPQPQMQMQMPMQSQPQMQMQMPMQMHPQQHPMMMMMPQQQMMGHPMPVMHQHPPMPFGGMNPAMMGPRSSAAQHAMIAQQNAMAKGGMFGGAAYGGGTGSVYGGGASVYGGGMSLGQHTPMQSQQQMPQMQQRTGNKPPVSEIKIGK